MEEKYKIGYIDEDAKQVKKYQRRFRDFGIDVIGYKFHKGMTLSELMNQVYNSDIDLLMIDYKLKETNQVTFNGEAVESEFYDNKPLFPHIIFTNKVDQAEPFIEDWKIIFDKEEIFSEENENEKVQHFINMLKRSIDQYRNHISKKKTTISELIEKGQEKSLDYSENDKLISLQRELGILDKTKSLEIPENMFSQSKLEDLSKNT